MHVFRHQLNLLVWLVGSKVICVITPSMSVIVVLVRVILVRVILAYVNLSLSQKFQKYLKNQSQRLKLNTHTLTLVATETMGLEI